MSVLALLLNADVKKIEEKQTKKMEIPRLSAALGAPFVLELQPIDPELYSEIQESAVKLDKKGGLKSIDTYALSVRTCVEGIKDPSMKDKGLMKKFGAASPNDLVKKLFLAGEISDISQEILQEFAQLKKKNYDTFLNDAKAYGEAQKERDKQFNQLIFKMRTVLAKKGK